MISAHYPPVQLHGHLGDGGGQTLHLSGEGGQVSCQDGVVDLEERLLVREGHVEDGEEGHEARVRLVTATAGLAHGCDVADVLHVLPVEILATVIDTAALQKQLEQSDGLLGAIRVHLKVSTRDLSLLLTPNIEHHSHLYVCQSSTNIHWRILHVLYITM